MRAPYFRHASGQIRDCLSFRDEHALERGYLHLVIQLQLHRWLINQGYEVTLEHRFTDASRADVHVTAHGHDSGRASAHAAAPARGHNATAGTCDAAPAPEDVHIRWTISDPGAGFDLDLPVRKDPTVSSPEPVSPRLEGSGALQPGTQTLEVQLSAISYQDLLRRDARYRRHTGHVTWLFGGRARALAGIQREQHGVSFGLWPRPRHSSTTPHDERPSVPDRVLGGALRAAEKSGRELATAASGDTTREAEDDEVEVWIGTCHPGDQTHWVPLHQCVLQADGLWTPTRDQALAEHHAAEAARVAREEREQLRARLEAQQRERERAALAERLRRHHLHHDQSGQHDGPGDAAPPGYGARGPGRHRPLQPPRPGPTQYTAGFLSIHPEVKHFALPASGGWLHSLPKQLQEPARLIAYRVSVLQASGPLSDLGFLDVADPERLIPHALQHAGVITLGPLNWSRRGPESRTDSPTDG
ncbi:hypothetical protein [Kineococcus rhizosphaerae]|uniref:hypothetical protein n=1 Tax=Kineococcus rhizosphaerae TaxID=559628 RepID=UPI001473CE95|nr:hypothetical protein [Kineococcus rhizosphaerae]